MTTGVRCSTLLAVLGPAAGFIAILIEGVGNRQSDIGTAPAQSVILLVITLAPARLHIRHGCREVR